jgi:hypothetical protein
LWRLFDLEVKKAAEVRSLALWFHC